MNRIGHQEYVSIRPQPQSHFLNLPKEIINYILSFDTDDRRVLLTCKSLYRIGFDIKDPKFMLVKAIDAQDVALSLKLLRHKKINPAARDNEAIRLASKYGYADICKRAS